MNVNNNAIIDQVENLDLQNHSGELWSCIGRKASPYGGYIYRFVAKEEFDNYTPNENLSLCIKRVEKKSSEIFPAIESTAQELSSFSKKMADVWRNFNSSQSQEFRRQVEALNEIGYQVFIGEDVQIELPDLEALLNGWKHLQNKRPELNLPDMDVVDSKGIADDVAYANAYRDHDALLSSGKEFVHDHTVHVMSRISLMLKGKESYESIKQYMTNIINEMRVVIEEAESKEKADGILHKEKDKLDFIVGMVTDSLFSIDDEGSIKRVNLKMLEGWLNNPIVPSAKVWNNYLRKRFGPDCSFATISKLWKEIRRLVENNHAV